MAISNRDRIGKMFELLAPPLDEFISRVGRVEAERGCFVDGARAAEGREEGHRRARSTTASIRRCSCGC